MAAANSAARLWVLVSLIAFSFVAVVALIIGLSIALR